MLFAPIVSTHGGSQPQVAPAVSVMAAAHRPSDAPAASTPNPTARWMSAAAAVSTRGGSQAFSRAKGQYPPPAVTCNLSPGAYCTVYPSRRYPSRPLRNVRLPFLVPRGRDGPLRGGKACFVSTRSMPITHSSDRGVCGAPQSCAGTRAASGRRRPALLHICASLRRRRARPGARPQSRTPSCRRHKGWW